MNPYEPFFVYFLKLLFIKSFHSEKITQLTQSLPARWHQVQQRRTCLYPKINHRLRVRDCLFLFHVYFLLITRNFAKKIRHWYLKNYLFLVKQINSYRHSYNKCYNLQTKSEYLEYFYIKQDPITRVDPRNFVESNRSAFPVKSKNVLAIFIRSISYNIVCSYSHVL